MGFYIAFEGIDGAGKTRCQKAFSDWLEDLGSDVVRVREPGDTPVGQAIRTLLLEEVSTISPWAEAAMFAADRAQLAAQVIRPALREGAWVLSDRSVYSSLAYQGVGRDLGVKKVKEMNQAALGGTWPELVVLIEATPQVGMSSVGNADRIGSENFQFMSEVADAYQMLANREPDRFVRVAAGTPIDEVVERVKERLRGWQQPSFWQSEELDRLMGSRPPQQLDFLPAEEQSG